MTPLQFEQQYQREWEELERLLEQLHRAAAREAADHRGENSQHCTDVYANNSPWHAPAHIRHI